MATDQYGNFSCMWWVNAPRAEPPARAEMTDLSADAVNRDLLVRCSDYQGQKSLAVLKATPPGAIVYSMSWNAASRTLSNPVFCFS